MHSDRFLGWDGCSNVRDLGGLATCDGATTRWGQLIRSESADRLSPDGWRALEAYGIRTVIDLRNDDEIGGSPARSETVTTIRVPIDDIADTQMWEYFESEGYGGLGPLYYPEFMRRKPERCAAAIAAIAAAVPGGVLIHCAAGRDRTGLVSLLALAVADVPAGVIAADHALTDELLAVAQPDRRPFTPSDFDYLYTDRGTTPESVITDIVDGTTLGTGVHEYLRTAGVTEEELTAVRRRLRA